MINYFSLSGTWGQARKPLVWARWTSRAIAWCTSRLENRALPREFAIDDGPDISRVGHLARLPLAMDQVWALIREGHVQANGGTKPSLPWLQSSVLQYADAVGDGVREELSSGASSSIIPLSLLQIAEREADSLWDVIEVTECFGDWRAEMGKLLREAEMLVDRHEDMLNSSS